MLKQALAFQDQGRFDDAIDLCEQILDSGFDRPDARYFLGWLYQEQQRWDEAIRQFQRLLNDPDYALSCYYALGQCYRARGDFRSAALHFDEAVDRVNLDTLVLEEVDQFIQLCQEAAETHRLLGDQEMFLTIYKTLLGFLRSRNWNDNVAQVEYLLQHAQNTPMPTRPVTTPVVSVQQIPIPQPPGPYAPSQIEALGHRYQLEDLIGRGGMAMIYRGRDRHMDRVVAVKVLSKVYSTDPEFVTRFQFEAKAASAFRHPNIVQVYDYGQSDGYYFIVMELVEGTDLHRYVRSRGGVLAIDLASSIAHNIALGLGATHHHGIVHCDIKPHNVLVGCDGSIKLTDFGIANLYTDTHAKNLTTTGMALGTVRYYAPEQAQGELVNPAADVYSLGIVMYEMLTGRTPFDGDTSHAVAIQHILDLPMPPSRLNPNIPPALEQIILRCLEKVPEMRFSDGNVLARALEVLVEEKPPPGSQ
jgi:tetratricopeptide (TPR) repeat protein